MRSGAELIFLLPSFVDYKDEVGRRAGKALEAFDVFGHRADPTWQRLWGGWEGEEPTDYETTGDPETDDRFRLLAIGVNVSKARFSLSDRSWWDATSFNFLVRQSRLTIEV
jgi:hypothetical protein